MMRMAQAELNVRSSNTIMVGDNMDTDVLGGVGMGYQTILVLSGHTRREDLARYAYQPDMILESIAHMPEEMFEVGGILQEA